MSEEKLIWYNYSHLGITLYLAKSSLVIYKVLFDKTNWLVDSNLGFSGSFSSLEEAKLAVENDYLENRKNAV